MNEKIAERLARGRVVACFPEGTTTDGSAMLPFRTALFEPAVRGAHPIQAVALAYRDASGRRVDAAAFVGKQNLLQSLLEVSRHTGIIATASAGPAIVAAGLTRREAARLAQAAVQERLPAPSTIANLRPSAGAWTSAMLSHTATLK